MAARRKPINQLWRDHMLAGSMLLADRWQHGSFVVIYPAENDRAAAAVAQYRACLADRSTFDAWTLERFIGALTRVATPANEDALLELALAATGAQLERICRAYRSAKAQDRPCQPEDRAVRRRDLPGGMVKLELVLAPDEADLVMRAVDCARAVSAESAKAETDPKADWPAPAAGLVSLAESFLAGNRPTGTAGDAYQVVVHVDQDPRRARC